MMNCVKREELFAYAERLLDSRREGEIRQHVTACAHCRTVVGEFERLDKVLEEWRPPEPSPWFDTRIRAALRATQADKASRWVGAWQGARRFAPALLTVLAVVVSLLILRPRQETPRTIPPGTAAVVHSAQPGPTPPVVTTTLASNDLAWMDMDDGFDYEMVQQFEVLSELPSRGKQVVH